MLQPRVLVWLMTHGGGGGRFAWTPPSLPPALDVDAAPAAAAHVSPLDLPVPIDVPSFRASLPVTVAVAASAAAAGGSASDDWLDRALAALDSHVVGDGSSGGGGGSSADDAFFVPAARVAAGGEILWLGARPAHRCRILRWLRSTVTWLREGGGGGGGGGTRSCARLLRLHVTVDGPAGEAATRAAVRRGLRLGTRRWAFLHGSAREGLAVFLAVAGRGLSDMPVEHVRAWAIPPTPRNVATMTLAKYAARMGMAFSDTVAGPVVDPRGVVLLADVRGSAPAGVVMTDGCAPISSALLAAAVAAAARAGEGRRDDSLWWCGDSGESGAAAAERLPAAVQGRLGGAKGVWLHSPGHVGVCVRPSMVKFEASDGCAVGGGPSHATLEVCRVSGGAPGARGPAALSRQAALLLQARRLRCARHTPILHTHLACAAPHSPRCSGMRPRASRHVLVRGAACYTRRRAACPSRRCSLCRPTRSRRSGARRGPMRRRCWRSRAATHRSPPRWRWRGCGGSHG